MIAESYERIHRSNLVGMGIVPLQYKPGDTAESLGLTGKETYTIELPTEITPGQTVPVQVCLRLHERQDVMDSGPRLIRPQNRSKNLAQLSRSPIKGTI